MPPVSSARATDLAQASLELTAADRARLLPRVASAPALVTVLFNEPHAQWATLEEVEAASTWLGAAATELNEPPLATSLVEDRHDVTADWHGPAHPLVDVRLDGVTIAKVDYLEASASAHWFLRWCGDPSAAHGPVELPLMPLATHVPEEAEEDADIRAAILDAAVEAAANELTGRPVRLQLRDA